MVNVLINALNLSIGGGKNILENYLKELSKSDLRYNYYVLTPNFDLYYRYSNARLHIIDIESIFKINSNFVLLYFLKFPILLKKYKIDLVFNFGDIIIPTSVKQIYFFDWPYAVYSERYIWGKMSLKDNFIRNIKLLLIQTYIHKVALIIAQTENISNRLFKYYKCKDIVIIPTPVGIDLGNYETFYDLELCEDKKYFFYPASYSTHKNFEMVLNLLKSIKDRNLPFILVLTLDIKVASDFLKKIKLYNLDNVINLGKVDLQLMPSLYKQIDALFFPSLLETYGLPYIEAMSFGKPILTSNLDFAHSICDEIAFYFDPFDVHSMLNVMMNFEKDNVELQKRISKGKAKVDTIPKWNDVVLEFESQIDYVLNKY